MQLDPNRAGVLVVMTVFAIVAVCRGIGEAS